MKYRVWFLDVWGNETDGYEVNDRSEGIPVELPEFAGGNMAFDHQIIETLQAEGYLNADLPVKHFTVEGEDETMLYIDSADGKPLLQLEKAS